MRSSGKERNARGEKTTAACPVRAGRQRASGGGLKRKGRQQGWHGEESPALAQWEQSNERADLGGEGEKKKVWGGSYHEEAPKKKRRLAGGTKEKKAACFDGQRNEGT